MQHGAATRNNVDFDEFCHLYGILLFIICTVFRQFKETIIFAISKCFLLDM